MSSEEPTPTPDELVAPSEEAPHYARRFAKNFAWMASSQVGGKIAGFVFVIIIARGLGAQQYGYFNFATSFVPLFLMFGTWGLEAAVISEIAKGQRRLSALFMSGLLLRISLGLLALGVAFTIAPALIDGGEAFISLMLVGFALFLDEVSGFIGTVFKAFERMRYYAQAIFINRILSTLLALGALMLGGNLTLVSLMYLLGSLSAVVFAWAALRKHFPPVYLADASVGTARELLGAGLPLGVAAVLSMAVFRIDAVMLQGFEGPIAVGMYGIAYRFLDSFLFVSWSLASVALPRIARSGATALSARTYQMTVALVLSFYLPIAVGSFFVSEWVVETVFSARYLPAAAAVPWLTTAGVFYGISYVSRLASIGVGRRWALAWVGGLALVLNVALNLYAIPRYGFEGAAAVTCITTIVEAMCIFGLFWTASGRFRLTVEVAVPFVAALVMGGVLALADLDGGIEVLLGAVVYVAALAVTGRLLAPAAATKVRGMLRRDRSQAGS